MVRRMQIYTTSKCQLRCEFCPRSDEHFVSPQINISMGDFISLVEKCIDYGIDEFELSPIVGEALLDPLIEKRVEYLNNHPKVRHIFFFTNLVSLNEIKIKTFQNFEKFSFKLSIYGANKEQFFKRTGVDCFEKVLNSLKSIVKLRPRVSEVNLRFPKLEDSLIHSSYRLYEQILEQRYKVVQAREDVNWVDSLLNVTTTLDDPPINRSAEVKKGHSCPFLEWDLGLWPNGDLGICSCWFDVNKKMILGNVNDESVSVILARLDKYKKEQEQGLFRSLCSVCTYPQRGVNYYE